MSHGPLDIYMHPELMKRSRRYRRSDDVYSLGVILLEIALWEPATEYCGFTSAYPFATDETMMIASRAFKAAKKELAVEVGELYQSAVIACLEGLRSQEKSNMRDIETNEDAYDGNYRDEDPEHGLECDLLWKVVRQLEKLRV